MARPQQTLRQELLQARSEIQRQIEVLEAGPASIGKGGVFIDNNALIERLTHSLHDIDERLDALQSERIAALDLAPLEAGDGRQSGPAGTSCSKGHSTKSFPPQAAVAGVILVVSVILVFKLIEAIQDPRHSRGFPQGWACTSFGRAAATVCAKDVPDTRP